MKIAITGANSSVGQNLLAHVVGNNEISVIAGVRTERAATSLPDSSQIQPRLINYNNIADLANALDGVDCVVHLAGVLIESKSSTYADANYKATANVAVAAKKAGVKHIIFISVVGASADSPNAYFRSKGDAERAVAESGISATIIRTPILLGSGTAGANSIIWAASQSKAKLLGGGTYCMRPLDVDDLSLAILNSCKNQSQGVSTHELVGPESIPYHQLVSRLAFMMGKEIKIGSVPIWTARLGAAITSRLKGGGISPTVIDVITKDEIVQNNADTELGVTLTPLSKTLEKILANKKS